MNGSKIIWKIMKGLDWLTLTSKQMYQISIAIICSSFQSITSCLTLLNLYNFN